MTPRCSSSVRNFAWPLLVPIAAAAALVALTCPAPPARAIDEPSSEEAADVYVARAIKRTEEGQWDDAIALFRAAERAFPRALHDCNIGLAYAKSDRPHLAWLYLGRCSSRSTATLPPWVDTRRKAALETLTAGEFAAVEFLVSPGGSVSLSSPSLPGEVLTPTVTNPGAPGNLTMWLPFGTHEIAFAGDARIPERRALVVDGAVKARKLRVEVTLAEVPPKAPDASKPIVAPVIETVTPQQPAVPPPPDGGTLSEALLWAGAGTLLSGAVVYGGFAYPNSLGKEGADRATFRWSYPTSMILMGTGGVTAGLGLALLAIRPRPVLPLDKVGSAFGLGFVPSTDGGLFAASGRF
jgi:hypothetical protein